MKSILKTSYAAALAVVCLAFPSASFAAEPQISVEVNGSALSFADASPFVNDAGRTMVPVRPISTSLGYHVTWNEGANEITLDKQGKQIVFKQNERKTLVNGREAEQDSSAQLHNNSLYVPVRFVSETLGQPVYWDPTSRTVGIGQEPASPVTQTIDLKATAYGHESGNLDYFGNPLQVGSVAVDPNVIPLGSKLLITGYDSPLLPKDGLYATAVDCGGAIKGNRLDIFIPATDSEVKAFGFQNVKVQVLK